VSEQSKIGEAYDRLVKNLKGSRDKPPTREEFSDIRDWFPRGGTVYLVLRKRASSGMQREIGIIVFKGNHDYHPNHAVSKLLNLRLNKNGDGVVVRGAGMDMGFHVVSHISQRLYGDATSLKHRWL